MSKDDEEYFINDQLNDFKPCCARCVHREDCNTLTPDNCDNYLPELDEWGAGL